MSMRTWLVVVLAVVCGLSAAVGVSQLRQPAGPVGPDMMTVVVAGTNLTRGRTLKAEDLAVRPWPKDSAPAGALGSMDGAVGRVVSLPIAAGEPLLESKLAAGRGMEALIPPGMRAYTIQTSRVGASVAGFILPGNKVDVLLNLRGNQQDDSGGGMTLTLLQAVEIIAVDQRLDAPAENKVNPRELSSVTLLVYPDQAAVLDLGQNAGQLSLALRNAEDRADARVRPATLSEIQFHREKPNSLADWLRGQIGHVAKGMGAASSAQKAEPARPRPTESTETMVVATLRGSQWGTFRVVNRR